MKSEFTEFPYWLWDTNSLCWHLNIRIKFPIKCLIKFRTFWCQFHILYANESREIRNHKNKISGTSMESFGNVSQDDIQKIMDKSKNKNATKAIATWMNVYHTWVKHRRSAWNRKSRTQKTWQNFITFILQNNKTDKHSILKLSEWSLIFW